MDGDVKMRMHWCEIEIQGHQTSSLMVMVVKIITTWLRTCLDSVSSDLLNLTASEGSLWSLLLERLVAKFWIMRRTISRSAVGISSSSLW